MDAVHELERGRESYSRSAWAEAYAALAHAERDAALEAEDLERLATAAYMLGRDDDYLSALERAHHAHRDAGEPRRAARCAFWIALTLLRGGETAPATGWLGRAQRLVESGDGDCAERGYLLIPVLLGHVSAGDWAAAEAVAAEAAQIGERFGEADLVAMAGHEQGHALVKLGRVQDGLRLSDEAMVAATSGELSPIVTGLVYCSVIAYCQDLYELRRAREWTDALSQWCERQPDMVAHTGVCQVHRAEIMQFNGAWPDALEEARRAGDRLAQGMVNRRAAGLAVYRQGELHRLRGDLPAAEEAYREASGFGCEPQPGLALLRLAQGNHDSATAAIRRVLGETPQRPERARLLAACVEIMLAAGEVDEARRACRELDEVAAGHGSDVLDAISAQARGSVALAEGDPRVALLALREAGQVWQGLEAPYEAARVRVDVGLACRALEDEDTAALEFEAARAAFAQLGAASQLAHVESLAPPAASSAAHGLTPRELQVLRLVAAGATNKTIAAELVLSARTVDRHVSNIYGKLRVSSRAAATAYAYEHSLV